METRPLTAVLNAFEKGAASLDEIARLTGLTADGVRGAVDHLIRIGRIEAKELASGCPSGGCGSCASSVAGAPGCGAEHPSPTRSGPVLVQLSVRKPD